MKKLLNKYKTDWIYLVEYAMKKPHLNYRWSLVSSFLIFAVTYLITIFEH